MFKLCLVTVENYGKMAKTWQNLAKNSKNQGKESVSNHGPKRLFYSV